MAEIEQKMAEIILFPTHTDYCRECVFYAPVTGACTNEKYIENDYYVVCVKKYCPYKKIISSQRK